MLAVARCDVVALAGVTDSVLPTLRVPHHGSLSPRVAGLASPSMHPCDGSIDQSPPKLGEV